jgi:hypothetical protein
VPFSARPLAGEHQEKTTMPKHFIPDAATLEAEARDREATAWLAARESAESKGKAKKRRQADALSRDVRRELSLMESNGRAKRIAKMRRDERNEAKERARKATRRDRERDARFATINTNLGSLLVQTFTTATAADRKYFLEVMGLAPANQEF